VNLESGMMVNIYCVFGFVERDREYGDREEKN